METKKRIEQLVKELLEAEQFNDEFEVLDLLIKACDQIKQRIMNA